MKLFASLVLVYYFFCNLVVQAYKPIASLFSRKQIVGSGDSTINGKPGFYKTLSGLLSSGKLSVLSHKHAEELKMIANDGHQEKQAPSWWPFVANKPRPVRMDSSSSSYSSSVSLSSSGALAGIPEERIRSDSTTTLTNLVKQTLELNRNEEKRRQMATYEFTNLAGFMEYDPKIAAKQAYKRSGRANHKMGMEWFRM